MNKRSIIILSIIAVGVIAFTTQNKNFSYFAQNNKPDISANMNEDDNGGDLLGNAHPLSIESLRMGEYPGSQIVMEQTLAGGKITSVILFPINLKG